MKNIYLLLSILLFQLSYSQLSSVHYVQPVIFSKYDQNTTINEEYIYLSTNSVTPITVSVRYPDETAVPPRLIVRKTNDPNPSVTFIDNGQVQVSNGEPIRLAIAKRNFNERQDVGLTPLTLNRDLAGTIIKPNVGGLVLSSDKDFYVNYRARGDSQAGSSMSKGKAALGIEFFWGGTPTEFKTTLVGEIGSMVSIMATENFTAITISNIKPGTKFLNGTNSTLLEGPIITRTLQKGESFVLYAEMPAQLNANAAVSIQGSGWLGSQIISDKKILVTVGGLMQQGGTADARDFALDQLVPVDRLGKQHVIMKGKGGNFEKVVVIATTASTQVSINGTPTYNLTNIGDYVIIPANEFSGENMYVETDKNVYVFHKIYGGTQDNNNSFMFIPPISCFGQKEVNLIPDANKIGLKIYANTELAVLAVAGEVNKPVVTINNVPLTPIGGTSQIVNGLITRVSYRYSVGGGTDIKNLKITSNNIIQAELIGSENAAGFGGYYSGFEEQPRIVATARGCVKLSTLSIESDMSNISATYQWYKNNVAIPGEVGTSYVMTAADRYPAEYHVRIKYPDGEQCEIESNKITSSNCPCYKEGVSGTPEITKLGISTRDKRTTNNWPTDINNGFIALESNDKGFVITRVDDTTSILEPIDGMLVFDKTNKCLKIYNGIQWTCINPTCN